MGREGQPRRCRTIAMRPAGGLDQAPPSVSGLCAAAIGFSHENYVAC
ncbi:MAG: hypothetical protein ACI9TF_001258 [Paracrocinitomix sp.]|jgi:hypothetical protein